MSQTWGKTAAVLRARSYSAPGARVLSDCRAILGGIPALWVSWVSCFGKRVGGTLVSTYRLGRDSVIKAWQWVQARRQMQLESKRLFLCETISLGEKRFLAIVKVDSDQFLVGGAPGNVSMLAQLSSSNEFAAELERSKARERLQA